MIQKRTVGIVGTGHVGMAAAYAIFMAGLAGDIILLDKDRRRAEGEAMDLMHGQSFAGSVNVRAGDFDELCAAQVVIVTAGVPGKAGESRLDLLSRNAEVFSQIMGRLDTHTPESVLIIASNPVDILTYITQINSRRPSRLVIGTGTMLDTARFRALLGRHYGVDPRSVHAYILGEHGDSEVPIWSSANIGGVPLMDNVIQGKSFERAEMDRMFERVRRAAYEIIDRKGYTNTAIGLAIARLVAAVLNDERSVLPVSCKLEGEYGIRDVCLSIPSVVGRNGIQAALLPELNSAEHKGLIDSADMLKQSLAQIGT